jgi:hypothetical protein
MAPTEARDEEDERDDDERPTDVDEVTRLVLVDERFREQPDGRGDAREEGEAVLEEDATGRVDALLLEDVRAEERLGLADGPRGRAL